MCVISLVVPCYNEEQAVLLFMEELGRALERMSPDIDYEFVFIDDGSTDSTLKALKILSGKDSRVKYISFSRNFGKEAAMLAGLELAGGDYIAIMDADLQDPPELLQTMYDTLRSGEYDCVATRRATRKGEPIFRSLFARMFYKLINTISKVKIIEGARDFRMMTRQVVKAILALKEYNRFSKGIFGWVGFRTKWLEYDNRERSAGVSKWSFKKLLAYSLEGIASFSATPLLLSSLFGLGFCLVAFILLIFVIVRAAVSGAPLGGFASTLCVIFLVGGVQLFCTGLLGLYLSKTHLETKRRPLYLVKETNVHDK